MCVLLDLNLSVSVRTEVAASTDSILTKPLPEQLAKDLEIENFILDIYNIIKLCIQLLVLLVRSSL